MKTYTVAVSCAVAALCATVANLPAINAAPLSCRIAEDCFKAISTVPEALLDCGCKDGYSSSTCASERKNSTGGVDTWQYSKGVCFVTKDSGIKCKSSFVEKDVLGFVGSCGKKGYICTGDDKKETCVSGKIYDDKDAGGDSKSTTAAPTSAPSEGNNNGNGSDNGNGNNGDGNNNGNGNAKTTSPPADGSASTTAPKTDDAPTTSSSSSSDGGAVAADDNSTDASATTKPATTTTKPATTTSSSSSSVEFTGMISLLIASVASVAASQFK